MEKSRFSPRQTQRLGHTGHLYGDKGLIADQKWLKCIGVRCSLRVTASRAHPAPVAPPPTTRTSNSSVSLSAASCAARVGSSSAYGTFSSASAETWAWMSGSYSHFYFKVSLLLLFHHKQGAFLEVCAADIISTTLVLY